MTKIESILYNYMYKIVHENLKKHAEYRIWTLQNRVDHNLFSEIISKLKQENSFSTHLKKHWLFENIEGLLEELEEKVEEELRPENLVVIKLLVEALKKNYLIVKLMAKECSYFDNPKVRILITESLSHLFSTSIPSEYKNDGFNLANFAAINRNLLPAGHWCNIVKNIPVWNNSLDISDNQFNKYKVEDVKAILSNLPPHIKKLDLSASVYGYGNDLSKFTSKEIYSIFSSIPKTLKILQLSIRNDLSEDNFEGFLLAIKTTNVEKFDARDTYCKLSTDPIYSKKMKIKAILYENRIQNLHIEAISLKRGGLINKSSLFPCKLINGAASEIESEDNFSSTQKYL